MESVLERGRYATDWATNCGVPWRVEEVPTSRDLNATHRGCLDQRGKRTKSPTNKRIVNTSQEEAEATVRAGTLAKLSEAGTMAAHFREECWLHVNNTADRVASNYFRSVWLDQDQDCPFVSTQCYPFRQEIMRIAEVSAQHHCAPALTER